MISNLWNFTADDGILGDLTPPTEIVDAQCKYLEEITNGKILAKISPYRGHDEYPTLKNMFEFEFFVTSTYTPNYKYSVMFMRHEIEYYPLTLDIDSDIVVEAGISEADYRNNIVFPQTIVKNEDEFIFVLSQIINSRKMKKVINSLYSMIKSQERRSGIISDSAIEDML